MTYKLHGPWRPAPRSAYRGRYGPGHLAIEVADLIDNRGNTFVDGAYRIVVADTGRRVVGKTMWKGETAWMSAERAYDDLVGQLVDERRGGW